MAKIDEQIAQAAKTLEQQPGNAHLWLRLGMMQRHNNDFVGAINSFTRCVAVDAGAAKAWLYIGFCFLDLFKLKEALDSFEFVLQIAPHEGEALFGLAVVRECMGEHEKALAMLDQAIALEPEHPQFYAYRASLRATHGRDPALTLASFRQWAERFADPLTAAAAPLSPERTPGRRLRIGYVSADLRDHAVAYFVEPVFARHDRANFEICVFSSGSEDHVTARIRPTVDHWFDVSAMDDTQVYSLIRRQKIDVLIDLSGHSRGNRLLAFARRAAPVQATWLGYMYTTGMRAMDYRITDAIIDPPGLVEAGHAESLFRLQSIAVYQPPADTPLPAPPMISRGGVALASLNHLKKVTDGMLLVWRRILEALPQASLTLISAERTAQEALARQGGRLAGLGLPLERVRILPRMPMDEFMRMGSSIDIALDTAPLSGGTTTLHSLWMGLPVVCMAGEQAFEASTASAMLALGYAELVAQDADGYVTAAVALAQSPQRVADFRNGVRARMGQSRLMDYGAFVRDLEASFRLMWLNYLNGERHYLHTGYDLQREISACKALPRAA
ncbi:MAG TPA: tetratricopeptide repeat protein [Burkholderiales bacterium]|jgi:predicted O-linked N-acetylglucosamine transferase (SPINDLY family)|nr:tetratricopeptide repeat protein [Burkholderiales bacterium]